MKSYQPNNELTTNVLSSKPSKISLSVNGKKKEIKEGYDIILEDTVLFPEGGGQPDDHGVIANIPVLKVIKKSGQVAHFTESSLPEGAEVDVEVDWTRRFDHMQQHSGQHLITAVAEDLFNFRTTSWNLGEVVSYVELDTTVVTFQQLNELESVLNHKIRECIPVIVHMYPQGAPELQQVRTRLELPEDHVGPVRVVEIKEVDLNTCCGTHVSNLSHLQVIKLLYVEKGKRNKTNLYFLVGERVLKYITISVDKEKSLTTLLKCRPEEHVQMVEKMQKALKTTQKNALIVLRDLALLEAEKFRHLVPKPSYYSLHRREGDGEFLSILSNEIGDEGVLLFLTAGEDKGPGHILLTGPPDIVATVGPQLCDLLQGKGSGKNGRFQAKVSSFTKRPKAEEIIKQALRITEDDEP
ncbi:alanyl-tRNA editing protein Aarsd1-B isoform X2 [Tachypleus tridentatus]|uniref:alanyl-tRNA editing protein Aarsd1-B isoform X2 n=1 Tax=Tachypleus tridentatus TaxID=6853 RepID=UPI003FD45DCA